MPSPSTPDAPRLFIISFKGDNDPVPVKAADRYAAKEKVIADIRRARPDLDYKAARNLILHCRIAPEQQLTRGPKPGQTGFRKPYGENDHSVPHW